MTTCERCGKAIHYEDATIWQRSKKGRTETKYMCSKCDSYMHMFSEPAYLPDRPDRNRLDAYIESLEREAKRSPRDQIKKFVKDLIGKGYGFKRIGEELGIGMDSALLIGAEIKEAREE